MLARAWLLAMAARVAADLRVIALGLVVNSLFPSMKRSLMAKVLPRRPAGRLRELRLGGEYAAGWATAATRTNRSGSRSVSRMRAALGVRS